MITMMIMISFDQSGTLFAVHCKLHSRYFGIVQSAVMLQTLLVDTRSVAWLHVMLTA